MRLHVLLVTVTFSPLIACGVSGSGSTCTELASEYAAALADSVACDPSASDPCMAERPVVDYLVENGQPPVLQGLCNVANAGYVNPERTARLDVLLARYAAAGCRIGNCPGPAPHTPICAESGSGSPTCE